MRGIIKTPNKLITKSQSKVLMNRQMMSLIERLISHHTKGQRLTASPSQSRKLAMLTSFTVPALLQSGIEYHVGREESICTGDDCEENSKESIF